MLEQIAIEQTRIAAPARRRRDHDAVDIDKTRIAGAEPLEIRTRVVGILIHRERRTSKACPTRCCSCSGVSQDNSRACALFSASRASPSGVAGATASTVRFSMRTAWLMHRTKRRGLPTIYQGS